MQTRSCLVWLGYPQQRELLLSPPFGVKLLTQLSPMLLVAYIFSLTADKS